MSGDHEPRPIVPPTGVWPRAIRILENNLQRQIDEATIRLEGLEHLKADELAGWRGNERRQGGVAFSDEQTRKIKELFDERAEVHAGRAFMRLVIWSVGSLVALATTLIVAYIKLRH